MYIMKNNITLNLNHSEKTRVEYFLNSVDAQLEQIPFDVRDLSHADDIIAGFKFKGTDGSMFITVIFATSYFHANDIATANSFHKKPHTNCTINGAILFVVESTDERAVSQILSLFAGKE
jgi:hypothetical protein